MTAGWGAERLTRDELLALAAKLHRARDAHVRQANQSHCTSGRAWRHFAAAAEMAELWGEVGDELIAYPHRAAAGREPEAGS